MNRVVGFVDDHRADDGVEPISATLSQAELPIAVSTYYPAGVGPGPQRRSVGRPDPVGPWRQYGVYGYREV